MRVLNDVLLILMWGAGLWYTFAIPFHFRRPAGSVTPPRLLVLLALGVTVGGAATALTLAEPRPLAVCLAASLLVLSSSILFWRALRASQRQELFVAFSRSGPNSLLRTGPYAYIRHPLYCSYVLFWLGVAVQASSISVIPLVACLIALYIVAAREEERHILGSRLATEYIMYMGVAGFFWPKFPRKS